MRSMRSSHTQMRGSLGLSLVLTTTGYQANHGCHAQGECRFHRMLAPLALEGHEGQLGLQARRAQRFEVPDLPLALGLEGHGLAVVEHELICLPLLAAA